MYLIGVDVGGTFTDIVFADTESSRTLIHKTPTTKDDPSRGVVAGISALCARFDLPRQAIDHVLHGTTIGTNAVLEYNGAVTGMITTAGYRDIVHIGRHQRPQHYSIRQEIPWQDRPLVQRRHRLTVAERLAPPRGKKASPEPSASCTKPNPFSGLYHLTVARTEGPEGVSNWGPLGGANPKLRLGGS